MDHAPVTTSTAPTDSSRHAFDQLDTLVRVTTVQAWVYLSTLFAVGAAAIALAVLYKVPTKVNGEGILLIDQDRLAQVRARATGRLVSLGVKLGDPVCPDQVIGRIAQDDLKDAIEEAKARLENLRGQDRELTQFEELERERKDEAMDRLKQAVVNAQEDSREKMKIAQRLAKSADKLRHDQSSRRSRPPGIPRKAL